jgi:hypothetical protein
MNHSLARVRAAGLPVKGCMRKRDMTKRTRGPLGEAAICVVWLGLEPSCHDCSISPETPLSSLRHISFTPTTVCHLYPIS